MYEKVNPAHPDKIADRIAGALVDLAYAQEPDPRIAVEVLLGHHVCHIIAETSTHLSAEDIEGIVHRIAGNLALDYTEVAQDVHLSNNQRDGFRCGDNGIFKGMCITPEQQELSGIARSIYEKYPTDGKYILDGDRLILCQSNAPSDKLRELYPGAEVNPLGDWTGGTDVDSGATNRKLGPDMADGITGGGLHGKDLSKADVSMPSSKRRRPASPWSSAASSGTIRWTAGHIRKSSKFVETISVLSAVLRSSRNGGSYENND